MKTDSAKDTRCVQQNVNKQMFVLGRRLAEKYKESQATKEKIQKSIEVKKEHLASLQPGLNAIMQVRPLLLSVIF